MRGDLATAEAGARGVFASADDAGLGQMSIAGRRLTSETLIELGRFEEADALLREDIDLSVRLGERWSRTELFCYRATCAIQRRDFAAAEGLLLEAEASWRPNDVAARAAIDLATGLLLAAQGRDAEAEAAYRAAVAGGIRTEYWWWQIDALTLAEFLAERGRPAEARELLDKIDAAREVHGYRLHEERREALRTQLDPAAATRSRPRDARVGA
jgi:hypothetical protein